MLPGESISKYQRQGQSRNQSQYARAELRRRRTAPAERPAPIMPASITANFPEDEPIFAAEVAEPLHEQHEHVPHAEVYEEVHEDRFKRSAGNCGSKERGARPVSETYSAPETTVHQMAHEADFVAAPQASARRHAEVAHGAVEEQEIEEEEADLTSYGEEPGDDEGFEEIEEETRAAGGELSGSGVGEIRSTGWRRAVETVSQRRGSSRSRTGSRRARSGGVGTRRGASGSRGAAGGRGDWRRHRGCERGSSRSRTRGDVVAADAASRRRSAAFDRGARTARWTALPQSRESGGAADQRTAQRRAGSADPDCEGADRRRRARASPVTSRCLGASWSSCRR